MSKKSKVPPLTHAEALAVAKLLGAQATLNSINEMGWRMQLHGAELVEKLFEAAALKAALDKVIRRLDELGEEI